MYKPTNITTATTTIVRGTPGSFPRLTINTPFTGTITLYDNASTASGTKIGTIAANATGGFRYDSVLRYGLVVVTVGTGDITVMTGEDRIA